MKLMLFYINISVYQEKSTSNVYMHESYKSLRYEYTIPNMTFFFLHGQILKSDQKAISLFCFATFRKYIQSGVLSFVQMYSVTVNKCCPQKFFTIFNIISCQNMGHFHKVKALTAYIGQNSSTILNFQ